MNNAETGENPDFAFYVEDSPWEPIVGTGKFYMGNIPSKKLPRFDELFYESRHKIARRICADCVPDTYKDVYYRRVDDSVGEAMGASHSIPNLAPILLGNFQPYGIDENVFNVDFKIYSSYEDALNDNNPWEYCEWLPPQTYGFPGNCKPNRSDPDVTHHTSRIDSSGNHAGGRQHVSFYSETVVEPENIDTWMSKDEEMDYFFFRGGVETVQECKEFGSAAANNIGDSGIIASLSTSTEDFSTQNNGSQTRSIHMTNQGVSVKVWGWISVHETWCVQMVTTTLHLAEQKRVTSGEFSLDIRLLFGFWLELISTNLQLIFCPIFFCDLKGCQFLMNTTCGCRQELGG